MHTIIETTDNRLFRVATADLGKHAAEGVRVIRRAGGFVPAADKAPRFIRIAPLKIVAKV